MDSKDRFMLVDVEAIISCTQQNKDSTSLSPVNYAHISKYVWKYSFRLNMFTRRQIIYFIIWFID